MNHKGIVDFLLVYYWDLKAHQAVYCFIFTNSTSVSKYN